MKSTEPLRGGSVVLYFAYMSWTNPENPVRMLFSPWLKHRGRLKRAKELLKF
jgi:hypothetical protein